MAVWNTEQITQTTTINEQTGEVTQTEEIKSTLHTERSDEPDFVKLYLDHLAIFNGTDLSINPVLAELLRRATYADSQNPHRVVVNAFIKQEIADIVGYKNTKSIDNAISSFVKANYLKRIARGVYELNPYYFGKGSWKDIKKLRATYDYVNHTVTATMEDE